MKAFPNGIVTDDKGLIVGGQQGMDLRDYFAAKALPAVIVDWLNTDEINSDTDIAFMARSYKAAHVWSLASFIKYGSASPNAA